MAKSKTPKIPKLIVGEKYSFEVKKQHNILDLSGKRTDMIAYTDRGGPYKGTFQGFSPDKTFVFIKTRRSFGESDDIGLNIKHVKIEKCRTKPVWVYYHIMFGNGSMGTEDGYRLFGVDDGYGTTEDISNAISETFEERYRDVSYSIDWWDIPKPPLNYFRETIKTTKQNIIYYRKHIKELKAKLIEWEKTKALDFDTEGKDDLIQKKFNRCVIRSLQDKLIANGIFVTYENLDAWKQGTRKPLPAFRDKVLDAIKKCEKYPSYKLK